MVPASEVCSGVRWAEAYLAPSVELAHSQLPICASRYCCSCCCCCCYFMSISFGLSCWYRWAFSKRALLREKEKAMIAKDIKNSKTSYALEVSGSETPLSLNEFSFPNIPRSSWNFGLASCWRLPGPSLSVLKTASYFPPRMVDLLGGASFLPRTQDHSLLYTRYCAKCDV